MPRWHPIPAVALAALTLSLAGCGVFPLAPGAPERAEKETVPGLPTKHSVRVSQFVFFSDFDIPRTQSLFKELGTLRDQVYKELSLPAASTQMVFVYIFEDREHFERFMQAKYPKLPRRRAFFVAQPRRLGGAEDLLVYTYWGDRITQDLRHELTHALLHSVLKDVPIWLDEGLAEFFEVPAGWQGVNYEHVAQLVGGPDRPRLDLERLERLKDVGEMSPAEYREAWAWTHWMLRGNVQARKELLGYIQELRVEANPGKLQPRLARLAAPAAAQVEAHLFEIERSRKAPPKK